MSKNRYFGLVIASLIGLQAQADQENWRSNLSDRCYRILHEKVEASTEDKEDCLSKFYGMTTIVISPNRREQELSKVAAPVAVVSSQNLEQRALSGVAEALRDIPGVEISDAGESGHKRIRIRGEQARRVMLLIDGQEFDDQREVGTPILIAPEMIDRIEVMRGPGSVLYGSKAIGGVINIITKKGGYHPVQGSASTTFDSVTRGWQQFATTYGSQSDLDYRIAGVSADHGSRGTPRGDLENTAYSYESVMGYIGRKFGDHKLGLSIDLYQSESDVFVDQQVRTTPPFLDFAIDIPERDRNKLGFFYDWQGVSDTIEKIHVDAYFQRSDRQFDTFSKTLLNVGVPVLSESTIRSGSELENTGLTAQSDWRPTEHHLVVLGYQLNQDNLSQNRLRQIISNGVPKPDELVDDDATRSSHSVFVQDEWRLLKDTALTVGGRAFWLEAELEETSRPGLSPNSTSDSDEVLNIGLSYSGLPGTTLWSRIAQGYLYPTLTEFATGAFAGPDYVNPNSGLRPETSLTYDVGLRFAQDNLDLDISAFFSEAEDLIDFVKCTESNVACLEPAGRNDRVYVNVDTAKSFGAESTVSYHFEKFTPYLSLAWLRRAERTEEFRAYDTGLPVVSSRTGLRWEDSLSSNVRVWADLYVRASTDSDERENVNEVNHKSGWATLNASSGFSFGSKRQARLILEIQNITDKYYTAATENLTAQGIGAAIKLALDF